MALMMNIFLDSKHSFLNRNVFNPYISPLYPVMKDFWRCAQSMSWWLGLETVCSGRKMYVYKFAKSARIVEENVSSG